MFHVKVLDSVPLDMNLQTLLPFLNLHIKDLLKSRSSTSIKRNLLAARVQQLGVEFVGRKERVEELGEDSTCLKCFKRLNSGVFAVGRVVTHVYCVEDA